MLSWQPRFPRHVTGFCDLVELWVIEIKMPMILCARNTSRSREQSTTCRSRSENTWKVCLLFYSQNSKILWLSNVADTFLRNSRGAQRFVGFFLECVLWCWLAGQKRVQHVSNWLSSLQVNCFCGEVIRAGSGIHPAVHGPWHVTGERGVDGQATELGRFLSTPGLRTQLIS